MTRITDIPNLPDRPLDAHKGMLGRVVVIGGSLGERGLIGAPALAANAALRSGAGLVQIATPPELMTAVITLAPCATARALDPGADLNQVAVDFGADVAAIGCGAGDSLSTRQLCDILQQFSGGMVIDADGLNTLATVKDWRAKWGHNVVLTPHPGEMKRLVAGRGLKLDVNDRKECTRRFAQDTGVVTLLKGAGTVVSDGDRVYINQTGNAGMATAGAGDVLTGVIAALIGLGMPAFDAAVLGVYVHGLAGDLAAEELGRVSMIATDVVDFLPEAFCDLEYGNQL